MVLTDFSGSEFDTVDAVANASHRTANHSLRRCWYTTNDRM